MYIFSTNNKKKTCNGTKSYRVQMFLTSATIYTTFKYIAQQCCEVSSLWGKVSAFLAFHNHLSYFG